MCVFLSVPGPAAQEPQQNPTVHDSRGGEGAEHAAFNQSPQPIELQCVLVQWPTPD